jgi:hypothetical protein
MNYMMCTDTLVGLIFIDQIKVTCRIYMGEIHCIQLKQRNYLFLKIEYAIKLLIEILMYKN